MTDSTSLNDARARRSGFGWLTLPLIAVVALYAGVRWHAQLGPWLGTSAPRIEKAEEREPQEAAELWACSMHPQVIRDRPGLCPICHMQLTPLRMDAALSSQGEKGESGELPPLATTAFTGGGPGAVTIDPAVVQNMGVRVAVVTEATLEKSLRLVGYLDEAEPNIHDVNLRVSGWIRRLHANTEGQHVEVGDPLFDLYSPELQIAVEELIAARRAIAAMPEGVESTTRGSATVLHDAAAEKLELMGLDRRQIDALAKNDKAPDTITFPSPVTGHVTEKPIVEGAAVKAGDRVLRIVDHGSLWLDAQVFERDLPFVSVGQGVSATIASRPGEPVRGDIIFIHPHVDPMTRTAIVRVSIANPSLALKPGMYATVRLKARIRDRAVMVPREAIIDTGDSQIAFVAQAVGRFEPRRVTMGLAADDGMVQVLEGLAPGETVVTSGQFLLDSESRVREAIQKYLNEKPPVAVERVGEHATPPTDSGDHAEHAQKAGQELSGKMPERAQHEIDSLVSAYLELSAVLGSREPPGAPLDPEKLAIAADNLRTAAAGTSIEPFAAAISKETEALRGHSVDEQRELFKPLSKAVIAIVGAFPPSNSVGSTLYRMECLMAEGDWLQSTPDVANPFYASGMKQCGTLVGTIALQAR